jgi:HK97 gp10 family phage protein
VANSAFVRMEVEGAQGLMDLLKNFEQNVRNRIARKALDAAAKPVVAAAKAKAPKRFGALKESIGVVHRKYDSGVVLAVIGPRHTATISRHGAKLAKALGAAAAAGQKIEPAYYAHLVEYGTAPHAVGEGSILFRRSTRIDPKTGKRISVKIGRGPQRGKSHPGAKAHPFLRPAWDANRGNALGLMRDVIKREVDRELGKVLKKHMAG